MTAAALVVPVVALTVADGFGWLGQALFSWRIVEQWLHSERAKRTVIPSAFWGTSLVASLCRLVYDVHRQYPVYAFVDLISTCIFARNLAMSRRPAAAPRRGSTAIWPLFLGVGLFALIVVPSALSQDGLFRFDSSLPPLALGFLGAVLWSGRNVVQWYESERRGASVLPPSFFWMTIAGSVCLFAYALTSLWAKPDWVNLVAFALNPIPAARNLILHARHVRATAALGAGADPAAKSQAPAAP